MCTNSDENNTSVDGNENGDTNNDTQQQQQQNTTSSTKVILITGASSGIGKATAIYLAEKGIATALTLFARRQEPLDKTAQELKTRFPKIQTLVVTGDASIAVDNQRAVDLSVATFGGLHGMFINAGVFKGHKSLVETSDEDIDTLLNTNVKSVIYAMRYGIPAIKATVGESNGEPAGSIVANSSCIGWNIIGPKSAGASIYAMSKAAVNSLVESAAIENAPRIRVNSVLPGLVHSTLHPGADAEAIEKSGRHLQPLFNRAGQPEEVAALVSFLLSNEASFISGTHVKVDGLYCLSGSSADAR